MPFAVAFEGLHPNPATEIDAVVPLHLRGDLADDAAERANERCRGTLRDRHREAQLAADRGHLGPDKASADDEDPARLGGQGLLQTGGGTWSPPAKRTCLFTRSRPTAASPSSHSASTSRTRGSFV